jgi:ankyrin repeat protein
VKTGDREKFTLEVMKYNVEVRDVIDHSQFNQNLCFAAAQAPTESKAMQMMKLMVQLGVDLQRKDTLKQSPLFYACKNGYISMIRSLLDYGLNINEIDTYG